MTDAEMQFFMGSAGALPLYAELRRRVLELWPETEGRFRLTDERRYGRSVLLFYRKETDVQD